MVKWQGPRRCWGAFVAGRCRRRRSTFRSKLVAAVADGAPVGAGRIPNVKTGAVVAQAQPPGGVGPDPDGGPHRLHQGWPSEGGSNSHRARRGRSRSPLSPGPGSPPHRHWTTPAVWFTSHTPVGGPRSGSGLRWSPGLRPWRQRGATGEGCQPHSGPAALIAETGSMTRRRSRCPLGR